MYLWQCSFFFAVGGNTGINVFGQKMEALGCPLMHVAISCHSFSEYRVPPSRLQESQHFLELGSLYSALATRKNETTQCTMTDLCRLGAGRGVPC